MNNFIRLTTLILLLNNILYANELKKSSLNSGEQIFKTYCWGCHHQTSMAFGPSFQEIANKRTIGEIQGHIVSPKSTYKQLGHKRSVMPAFGEILTQKELEMITEFIISQKGKE